MGEKESEVDTKKQWAVALFDSTNSLILLI